MEYKLKAYTIWEQGPRPKQEDSIFPEHGQAKDTDRLFIVCDGMGGHSAGEVASSTVCKAMKESVFTHCPNSEGVFTDDDFAVALNEAFLALDAKDNGAEKKMGTTLTFLKLHADGCTIAHIGDSRVYHIRPGKNVEDTQILFQTIDHSLVNDLVKTGVLTPEEAKHSKQKNVITRAMQPNMSRRTKAALYHSSDIQPGDYFMLCSDGILEQMEDDNIKFIFSEKAGDANSKVDMLVKATEQNHDNHSAILVQVTDVINPILQKKSGHETHVDKLPACREALVDDEEEELSQSKPTTASLIYQSIKYFILFLLLGTLCFVGYKMISKKFKSNEPSVEETPSQFYNPGLNRDRNAAIQPESVLPETKPEEVQMISTPSEIPVSIPTDIAGTLTDETDVVNSDEQTLVEVGISVQD